MMSELESGVRALIRVRRIQCSRTERREGRVIEMRRKEGIYQQIIENIHLTTIWNSDHVYLISLP